MGGMVSFEKVSIEVLDQCKNSEDLLFVYSNMWSQISAYAEDAQFLGGEGQGATYWGVNIICVYNVL